MQHGRCSRSRARHPGVRSCSGGSGTRPRRLPCRLRTQAGCDRDPADRCQFRSGCYGSFSPVSVEHELVLRIGPVVRLEAVRYSQALEAVDPQAWPSAVDKAVRLQARDPQHAPAEVLVQPLLFDIGVHQGVAVVAIDDKGRRDDLRKRDRAGVGVAKPVPGFEFVGCRRFPPNGPSVCAFAIR